MAFKIGWYILIYLVVGRIIDIAATLTLVAIAAYKDEKRKEKNEEDSHMGKLNDTMEEAQDKADLIFHSDNHKINVFKTFLFGWVLWPITVPLGVNELWNNMQ